MVLILGTLLNRLFNTTFETMSGLSEGANLVLLKTIFEVYTGFGEAKRQCTTQQYRGDTHRQPQQDLEQYTNIFQTS